MTIGDAVVNATLNDSETAKNFIQTLPRTIPMQEYGGREYYGRMDPISEKGVAIPDFENGDITYYPAGPSFAVFYANSENSSQDDLIDMGKITSDLSVFENLDDSVEMQN